VPVNAEITILLFKERRPFKLKKENPSEQWQIISFRLIPLKTPVSFRWTVPLNIFFIAGKTDWSQGSAEDPLHFRIFLVFFFLFFLSILTILIFSPFFFFFSSSLLYSPTFSFFSFLLSYSSSATSQCGSFSFFTLSFFFFFLSLSFLLPRHFYLL
jgi:hypothetical protein